jgi:hydroxymethylglutaryl-CoA reductase
VTSRLPGFFRLTPALRRAALVDAGHLPAGELAALEPGALTLATADAMIENVIGTYALPLAVAVNLRVDGRDVVVPMAVEEPSVVAATSNAARLARAGAGFLTSASAPIMIGQVQLTHVPDPAAATEAIRAATPELLALAHATMPRLRERGGGLVAVHPRVLGDGQGPDGGMVVTHLHVDCRDAMGANLVNTLCEALAPRLAALAGGTIGLRILSNLTDERLVHVRVDVPIGPADTGDRDALSGEVAEAIAAASRFAELDPYRAATHNKGLMNGIDAALLATGQDFRAVEAGAHAYAARSGRYAPLATWRVAADGPAPTLRGELTMPLALGVVGGALHVHPTARLAVRLTGATGAAALARVIAAAGLATNLAALRALATEGIQRGHMALHARAVARAAGATDAQLDAVAAELAASGDVKPERARAILARATPATESPAPPRRSS